MRKRAFILSLLLIPLLAILSYSTVYSFFSDSATSQNNIFSTAESFEEGNLQEQNLQQELPFGEITNPQNDGDSLSGVFNFTATYTDGDAVNDDAVQWAIRQGTCAAGTGTVFGNVDGHSDAFSWDGASFSSTLDTATLPPGEYCFVFNPTDDPGENNVRETKTFIVEVAN